MNAERYGNLTDNIQIEEEIRYTGIEKKRIRVAFVLLKKWVGSFNSL